jgi:hypothetical protein
MSSASSSSSVQSAFAPRIDRPLYSILCSWPVEKLNEWIDEYTANLVGRSDTHLEHFFELIAAVKRTGSIDHARLVLIVMFQTLPEFLQFVKRQEGAEFTQKFMALVHRHLDWHVCGVQPNDGRPFDLSNGQAKDKFLIRVGYLNYLLLRAYMRL